MHDMYEIETYLKYRSEGLTQEAEKARQLKRVKKEKSIDLVITWGWYSPPLRIVVEGELK